MSEQSGQMSVVARRRLTELLSEPTALDGPRSPAPPASSSEAVSSRETVSSGEAVSFGEAVSSGEAGTDWITQLRAAGPGTVAPSSAVDAPVREPQSPRPSWLQTALSFTREHLVTVVVVLIVGIAWTGYSLFQVRTTSVADAVPRVEASGAASASTAPSATPSPAELVVHVIGSVRRAGVYRLPEGSRVADAIAAAGGLTRTAATGELNLAQVLSDGTQLKIGTRKRPGGWLRTGSDTESSAGPGTDPATAKLSINTATEAQLDTLPGIGPVTAAKIVAWRTEHGKFTALTELQEVDGIGPKTYADLAERVRL